MKIITSRANANIALVKYWGKAHSDLNIPAVPSLSMTLDGFCTSISLSLSKSDNHELYMEQKVAAKPVLDRLSSYLESVRNIFNYKGHFKVMASSNIPFSAGLASSSSFFAALSKALDHYLKLDLSLTELSCLARLGSASSARSIFGHYVGLTGSKPKHEEAYAFSLESKLDLVLLVAMVDAGIKPYSSREAMNLTAATSPYYPAFVATAQSDFDDARFALSEGQFEKLGQVMEHSTLKMHSSMWAATPSINYFLPKSIALIEFVRELRKSLGPIAFFTLDAGPNVKILSEAKNAELIKKELLESSLAQNIKLLSPGTGAEIIYEFSHE